MPKREITIVAAVPGIRRASIGNYRAEAAAIDPHLADDEAHTRSPSYLG